MKVNAISAMSYGYGVSKPVVNTNKAMTNPLNREVMEYPKGYIPYQINFAGSGYAKLPGIKLLKTVKELPCLYCAQKMVQSKTIESLSAQNSTVTRTIKELADTLHKKIGTMEGISEGLMVAIDNAVKKNPTASSADVIDSLEMAKKAVPNVVKKMTTRPMTASEYARHAINTVAQYEDGLMPTEKQVFKMIKSAFEQNPNKSIAQIMADLRTNSINGFENSQIKIIDEIEEVAKTMLSKQTKDRVLRETQKSKSLLSANNTSYPFKRKKFIDILDRIPLAKNDVDGMAKIIEKAESIPTSGRNTSAFIAKYSNRNVPKANGGFVSRSDSEIMQRLLDPSVQSVEHIRPQVTFKTSNGEYKGAKDVIENLALAHKQCNSDRGHLTLEEYMRINPKARESIQKHVDFLIKEIKAGRLQGMENYPKQLQETFSKETNGRVMIDISEIKEYLEKFMAKKH